MSIYVSRGERLAARKVAGEMVVLAADDSSLFVLNEVGTSIWEAADGRRSIDDLADGVCRDYDIDRETARRDVETFVEALVAAGVLATSDRAAA
jgi:hypothetical protein